MRENGVGQKVKSIIHEKICRQSSILENGISYRSKVAVDEPFRFLQCSFVLKHHYYLFSAPLVKEKFSRHEELHTYFPAKNCLRFGSFKRCRRLICTTNAILKVSLKFAYLYAY